MRYKGILIDADETLFNFEAGERNAAERVLKHLGITDTERALNDYHEINAALWRDLEKGSLNQAQLKVMRFEQLMKRYQISGDPNEASEYYIEALSEQSMLLDGALETVRKIAARVPVSVVTNGIAKVQRGRMGRSPLRHLIRDFIISEEIGFAKPDPRVMEIALSNLGIQPGEALMVGDGVADVRGALNAGVDACWFNPKGKSLPEDLKPQYEIKSLSMLPDIALQ